MTESTKYLLPEDRIPKRWYNIQADLPRALPPVLHPGTLQPIGPADLAPLFPMDLARRLAAAFDDPSTEIAMAAAREDDGQWRAQPVFCLMRVGLLESLAEFTRGGGRKIDRWTAQHRTVVVPFDRPGDDPLAFANANTLDELHALEKP